MKYSDRAEHPEEWAEIVLLFEKDLVDNPQTFIQQVALDMLELAEGETIAEALNCAAEILHGEDLCQEI